MSSNSELPAIGGVDGEIIQGSKNSQIRHMSDNSVLLRSSYSSLNLKDGDVNLNYSSLKSKSITIEDSPE